jgi:hypothetical protein
MPELPRRSYGDRFVTAARFARVAGGAGFGISVSEFAITGARPWAVAALVCVWLIAALSQPPS